MSDNFLQLIPTDPQFKPTQERAKRARLLLSQYLPEAEDINASFKDSVQFFHNGSNWSGVRCSLCGEDAEEWWFDAMDKVSEKEFQDLNVQAGCCGAVVSLNDLRYEWPVAFGSFALEVRSPNIPNLNQEQRSQLATAIGHDLRTVWVHL